MSAKPFIEKALNSRGIGWLNDREVSALVARVEGRLGTSYGIESLKDATESEIWRILHP